MIHSANDYEFSPWQQSIILDLKSMSRMRKNKLDESGDFMMENEGILETIQRIFKKNVFMMS